MKLFLDGAQYAYLPAAVSPRFGGWWVAQGVSVLRLSLDVMVREGETRRGQLVEVGGVGEGEVVCPKRRAHVIDLRVACGVCAVSTWGALAWVGWGGGEEGADSDEEHVRVGGRGDAAAGQRAPGENHRRHCPHRPCLKEHRGVLAGTYDGCS